MGVYGNQTEEERRLYETDSGARGSAVSSGGECVGRVNVDRDSGMVTVVGLIDFEYSAVINCRVLAIDSGSPPKTGDPSFRRIEWFIENIAALQLD